ncbi:MAG: sigma-54-dependent transcriptional regulator [Acidithiobacillus sp.]|uniref:sigma-54-dependent transcriptional regulator n=1 Tax=Acidithiobacillus sp. TaxID=1872118 RepID=UPI003CFC05F3
MAAAGARVLLVEDDVDFAEVLAEGLEEAGMEVQQAADGKEALNRLRDGQFDLILSDAQMQPMDGYGLLAALRAQPGHPPVVMMTAWGTIDEAVRALQNGAVDYLVKPFAMQELLTKLQRHERPQSGTEPEPLACSPVMLETLIKARRVAQTEASVLLTGESGVGKEVLARFIHRESNRAREPFVAVNCAAIPESLLEATLFGHEKGAFTGATQSSPGKFEQAQGGTLLLDEVTEMALPLQAKLLRVLQERELERVGGRRTIRLDVRVIATSNRDLRRAVSEGKFREDLYYRLQVIPLCVPPLRQRREDILPLAQRLLTKHCERMAIAPKTLDPRAQALLLSYPWPGNVRELDNALQRAAIFSSDTLIRSDDLGLETQAVREHADSESSSRPILEDVRSRQEQETIVSVLRECRGSRNEAARRLGISPRTLRHKLQRYREMGRDLGDI